MTSNNNFIHPQEIGFDIDCVVADTMEAFIHLARDIYNIQIEPAEITLYNVEDCQLMAPRIVDDIFKRLLVDPITWGLKLVPKAKMVLGRIAKEGSVNMVTARPDKAPIYKWLAANLGSEIAAKINLIAMGDHDGKGKFIKDLGLNYFIDDRLETCQNLVKNDINAIVYNQPWNQGHNLPKVHDWQEIEELITFTTTNTS